MSDDRTYVLTSRVILFGAGAVVGLVHYGLFRAFLESIRAAEEIARISSDGLAPFTIFIIASAVSGLGLTWLAEQRNVASVLTIAACIAVAVGVETGLVVTAIRPLPTMAVYLLLTSGASMLIAAVVRWRMEG